MVEYLEIPYRKTCGKTHCERSDGKTGRFQRQGSFRERGLIVVESSSVHHDPHGEAGMSRGRWRESHPQWRVRSVL